MLGDNINLIPMLANESVDLIYCDPPFNSNRNYIVTDDKDVKYFKDVWKGGQDTYLEFMFDRLLLLRQVLKPTGSIYLHCDPTMSHYLKITMDKIFGRGNFRNEVVWCYSGGGIPKNDFPNKHDIIFRYSKTSEYMFNAENVRVPYDSNYKGTSFFISYYFF